MPAFKIDKLSDEENEALITNWWKYVVKMAEEQGRNIPEEVMRKVEAVVCEAICTDKIKIAPEALRRKDDESGNGM